MNHAEIENINRKIGQYDVLKESFYVSGFQFHPHIFHLKKPERGNRVAAHTHSTYEISTIIGGGLNYIIDENECRLGVGDVIIIPPKIKHCWNIRTGNPLMSSFMCFISDNDGNIGVGFSFCDIGVRFCVLKRMCRKPKDPR